MDRHYETIDALLDGERVDASELKHALADAEGRNYLVDALALRELVAESSPAAGRVIVPVTSTSTWQRRVQWPAAAAILTASLLAGFAAGYRSAGARPTSAPAARETSAGVGAMSAPAVLSAPAPTRVIRLEPGVDWTEGVGGD